MPTKTFEQWLDREWPLWRDATDTIRITQLRNAWMAGQSENRMLKLTTIDNRALIIAPCDIAKVTEPATSQAWHGVGANVQDTAGRWFEVREAFHVIQAQLTA